MRILLQQTQLICTACAWSGEYEKTVPVMYHGIDWQQCPACRAIVIPNIRTIAQQEQLLIVWAKALGLTIFQPRKKEKASFIAQTKSCSRKDCQQEFTVTTRHQASAQHYCSRTCRDKAQNVRTRQRRLTKHKKVALASEWWSVAKLCQKQRVVTTWENTDKIKLSNIRVNSSGWVRIDDRGFLLKNGNRLYEMIEWVFPNDCTINTTSKI